MFQPNIKKSFYQKKNKTQFTRSFVIINNADCISISGKFELSVCFSTTIISRNGMIKFT